MVLFTGWSKYFCSTETVPEMVVLNCIYTEISYHFYENAESRFTACRFDRS